jgi:hypothetical protein
VVDCGRLPLAAVAPPPLAQLSKVSERVHPSVTLHQREAEAAARKGEPWEKTSEKRSPRDAIITLAHEERMCESVRESAFVSRAVSLSAQLLGKSERERERERRGASTPFLNGSSCAHSPVCVCVCVAVSVLLRSG